MCKLSSKRCPFIHAFPFEKTIVQGYAIIYMHPSSAFSHTQVKTTLGLISIRCNFSTNGLCPSLKYSMRKVRHWKEVLPKAAVVYSPNAKLSCNVFSNDTNRRTGTDTDTDRDGRRCARTHTSLFESNKGLRPFRSIELCAWNTAS
jgi:hypothetical protein